MPASSSPKTECLQRGSGQWGLLGGSSNATRAKPKLSKLASLAKSNRGASDKNGVQQKGLSYALDSVARLSSLSSKPRPNLSSSSSVAGVPEQEAASFIVDERPGRLDQPPNVVEAPTDHCADHLLAHPSTLADSLFHFWVVPQNTASLLLKIYANTSLLIVGGDAQSKDAFSTPSPDDVVQNAHQRNKGRVTHR